MVTIHNADSEQLDQEKLTNLLTSPKGRWKGLAFDPNTLETKSRAELIDIIHGLLERLPQGTDRIRDDTPPELFVGEIEVKEYVWLPTANPGETHTEGAWKMHLVSADSRIEPLGLIVHDEVLIGRVTRSSTPDLDLTLHGGTLKGVSRLHAMMRPTASGLVLIDLDSTNGTYRNGMRLNPGIAERLEDSDTISFGEMHYQVKILEGPESI